MEKTYAAWKAANPALAKELDAGLKNEVPADLLSRIPEFPADAKIATRKAGSDVLQPVAEAGANSHRRQRRSLRLDAQLHQCEQGFQRGQHAGRNIRFGIREHGMCGILNGIAYDGIFRPSGATFLVFADYCRGFIRLASLSGLPRSTSSRTTASASARMAPRTSRWRPSAACA